MYSRWHKFIDYADNHEETKTKVLAAFKQVRKELHAYARYDFLCCGNCATSALQTAYEKAKNKKAGAIYCHRQDVECFDECGVLYIGFGAFMPDDTPSDEHDRLTSEFGAKVVEILKAHGLYVVWDGSAWTRIKIDANPVYGCDQE